MEQQDKQKSAKWYEAEKTSPEKTQKITQAIGIIISIICFIIASLAWADGNHNEAKSLIIWGVSIFILFTIIPKTNLHKKYIEFMQKKATDIKEKRNKNIN